jgi:fatty-acyl-CoA synthase
VTDAPSSNRHVISRWLSDRARSCPSAIAIEYAGRGMTYAQLHGLALGMSGVLARLGVQRGDRVATLTENSPEHVALLFACGRLGAALVPLNWRLTGPELAAQLDVVSPSVLASSPAYEALACQAAAKSQGAPELVELAGMAGAATAPRRGPARGMPGSALAGSALAGSALAGSAPVGSAPVGSAPVGSGVADSDPLLVVFTSGSTGRPKGAVLSHANCFWTNLALDLALPLVREDVVLAVLPQFHVGGWNVQPLQALWKGAKVVLEAGFDAERALWLIEKRGVTTMMGVPTNYLRMAEAPGFAATCLSSLRFVVTGGAPLPAGVLEAWQRRGVGMAQGYGLTEAGPNVASLAPEDAKAHPGSVGKPYSFVEVALHDPESGAVAEGVGSGELWVSGPSVFSGYWADEAATAEVLVGGWLRTGDLAGRDPDGYLQISGRLKDMYISGGENVYPAEVEAVLSSHPGIAEAAVVAAPDPRWGESGVAFVRLRAGARVGPGEILAHCRGRLARYKVPWQVVVVKELPRLGSGKVDKRRLGEMAASLVEALR